MLLLDPAIEDTLAAAMRYTTSGSYLDLDAPTLGRLERAIHGAMQALPSGTQRPQILTRIEIRACLRRLLEPSLPQLLVLSYQELVAEINIQPVGRISLDGFSARKGVTVGEATIRDHGPAANTDSDSD